MSRSVAEWIGKTPDAKIPPRVQLRVFQKFGGTCPTCTRKLKAGEWACDHIVALINGGAHRESNLQPLCVSPCHSQKTREDVAEKAYTYKRAASHAGVTRSKQKIPSRGFAKAEPQRKASSPVNKWKGFS